MAAVLNKIKIRKREMGGEWVENSCDLTFAAPGTPFSKGTHKSVGTQARAEEEAERCVVVKMS
jgi:hypothetical protein